MSTQNQVTARIINIGSGHLTWLLMFAGYCVFLSNLFHPELIPFHDSGAQIRFFHYVYSQLSLNRDLVDWTPRSGFGTYISYLYLFFFTGAAYLSMFLGILLKIQDAFFVFKISIALEGFILLCGTYLLAREFFTRRSVAAIVSFIPLLSTPYIVQHAFGFSDVHLLPFVLYLFLTAFKQHSDWRFWAGVAFGIAGLRGYAIYNAAIFALIAASFGLFLLFHYRRWRFALPRTPAGWTWLLFASVLLIGLFIQLDSAFDGFVVETKGRNSEGKVSLREFLVHGSANTMNWTLSSLFSGISYREPHLYAGLLTLFFAIFGLFADRSRFNLFFGFLFLGILGYSFGGVISINFYYLPLMDNVRNIRYITAFLVLILAILAGFGLNAFFRSLNPSRIKGLYLRHKRFAQHSVLVFIGLLLLQDSVQVERHFHNIDGFNAWTVPIRFLLLALAVSLFWLKPLNTMRTLVPLIVGAILLIDLSMYNYTMHGGSVMHRYTHSLTLFRNIRPLMIRPGKRYFPVGTYSALGEIDAYGEERSWRLNSAVRNMFGDQIARLRHLSEDRYRLFYDSEQVERHAHDIVAGKVHVDTREESSALKKAADYLLAPCKLATTFATCNLNHKFDSYRTVWQHLKNQGLNTSNIKDLPEEFLKGYHPRVTASMSEIYYYDSSFFPDMDQCTHRQRWDVVNEGLQFLKRSLKAPPPDFLLPEKKEKPELKPGEEMPRNPIDLKIDNFTGCGIPWMRFPEKIETANNFKEIIERISESDPEDLPLYILDPEHKGAIVSGDNPANTSSFKVGNFAGNRYELTASVGDPGGAWFYMADSYHDGWKAYLDDREIPIYRGNVGYKTIHIPQGSHKLTFRFHYGIHSYAMKANAITNGLAALLVIICSVIFMRRRQERVGLASSIQR